MARQYSDALVKRAVLAAQSRGTRTIRSIAEELDVEYQTLKQWLHRKSVNSKKTDESKEKRPQDWTRDEQLGALMQTYGLSEEAVSVWCRERGIFPHNLEAWKESFTTGTSLEAAKEPQDARALRRENDGLRSELLRKDKALAEAAALLVLQKKFRALWEDEEK